MAFGTYIYIEPSAERCMQLLVAGGPLALFLMMRMVLGRSKEMLLAIWISIGWLAIRASLNPQMAFIREYTRPIERLLVG